MINHAIILIGFPKSGKTTLGKALSKQFNHSFCDTDQEILKYSYAPSIREFVKSVGIERFRKRETEVLEQLQGYHGVLSTGGGLPLAEKNRASLKKLGSVVFLDTPIQTLFHRMTVGEIPTYLDSDHLLKSFEELLAHRRPIYESLADCHSICHRCG